MEDAWQVGFNWSLGGAAVDVFAVFDGVGGTENGALASLTARNQLEGVLARSSPSQVLPALSDEVRRVGGSSTAVVVALPPQGEGWLMSCGDSAAYEVGIRASKLTAHDDEASATWLGDSDTDARAQSFRLSQGSTLILCTDGVDGVVGAEVLGHAPQDLAQFVERVITEVVARGMPDNATLIAVRRSTD